MSKQQFSFIYETGLNSYPYSKKIKRFIEQDVYEQKIKKLKLEFEDIYQQIEEEAIKVINKMKEEIKEKNKIIDKLVE
ncbi:27830_t:CDS:1, partial [Dentiscutata erythropus]